MSDNAPGVDPIDALIAVMQARIEKIQTAIDALLAVRGEFVSGSTPIEALVRPAALQGSAKSDWESDPTLFRAMSIPDAAIKLLRLANRPLKNPEIAQYLRSGGLIMNSADPVNTIGSVLTRRWQQQGDIVKHGRGTWILKEWGGRPVRVRVRTNTPLTLTDDSSDDVLDDIMK